MDARRRNAQRPSIEIFPILCEPSATPEPCEGSFDDPAFWQDDKAFSLIRALDDFDVHACQYFRDGVAEHRALIAAIGVEFQQERIQAEHGRHDQCTAIAVLDIGGVHDGMDQQALRVDENMPLLALDLLSRVVTRRINRGPPFSALFTLWLSITAAVGLASFATASRHFT